MSEIELPDGWEKKFDPKSRRNYYVNHKKKKSHWKLPKKIRKHLRMKHSKSENISKLSRKNKDKSKHKRYKNKHKRHKSLYNLLYPPKRKNKNKQKIVIVDDEHKTKYENLAPTQSTTKPTFISSLDSLDGMGSKKYNNIDNNNDNNNNNIGGNAKIKILPIPTYCVTNKPKRPPSPAKSAPTYVSKVANDDDVDHSSVYDEDHNSVNDSINGYYSATGAEIDYYFDDDSKIAIDTQISSRARQRSNTMKSVSSLSTPSVTSKTLEKRMTDEPELLTLPEIIVKITSKKSRGTKDFMVLFHTYCLYSSRHELLESILEHLCDPNNDNKKSQIKTLSLLRSWIKQEDQFQNIATKNSRLKKASLKFKKIDTEKKRKTHVSRPSVFDKVSWKKRLTALKKKDKWDFNAPIEKDTVLLKTGKVGTEKKISKTPNTPRRTNSPHNGLLLSDFGEYFRQQLMLYTSDNDELYKLTKPLINNLKKNTFKLKDRQTSKQNAPVSRLPGTRNVKELNLFKIDALEVARQLTLIEYELFRKIETYEFLKIESHDDSKMNKDKKKTPKKTKEVKSLSEYDAVLQPQIKQMISYFNRAVSWIQCEILQERDLNKRIKILNKIIKTCDKLFELNNISTLCALYTGLMSSAIHRLTLTWNGINKTSKVSFDKYKKLFSLPKNRGNLREYVKNVSQPAIPHLGLFLGDIEFIHEGNKTIINDKINWSKMQYLADRIQWVSQFQSSPFIFKEVDIIAKYLNAKMKIIPQEFLHILSKEVEPPQPKN